MYVFVCMSGNSKVRWGLEKALREQIQVCLYVCVHVINEYNPAAYNVLQIIL